MIHRDQEYKNETDLQIEPIYNTEYKIVKLDDAKLEAWAKSLPKQGEALGHPPPNTFVPKEKPQSSKVENDGEPAKPTKIQGDKPGESVVWFKQDDTFDHPYVWSKVELFCSDLSFPMNVEVKALMALWSQLLAEDIRELNYNAELAGLEFSTTWNDENLTFHVYSYDDGYVEFYSEVFKRLQSFEPIE